MKIKRYGIIKNPFYKYRLKNIFHKILCFFGFHKNTRADRGETGEIYVICRYCRKELE